jgi:predicted Rossmann fold flavoprotein
LNNKFDVIVIGAGPAGIIAASKAAESGKNVLLIEKMERPGRKLLITGKGRCNITNNASQAEFLKHIYPNSRFLKHAFSSFFNTDIVNLLAKYGVETVVERGERVFPASDKSADVLQGLLKWAAYNKVTIQTGCKAEKIITQNKTVIGVEVNYQKQRIIYLAPKIILCTGGCSYPATGSNGEGYKMAKELGHHVTTILPALVPIETSGNIAEQLQGLSLKNVTAKVWVNGKKIREEFGEMLFTHFGLSGPIVLTLSRLVVEELNKKNKVEISIDLKPALDENKLDIRLQRDLNEHGKKRVENAFRLWLPSKLIPVFMTQVGIDPNKECHQVNAKERRKIMLLMKEFRFTVTGHRSFNEAIITAGGINLNEIDPKTMESKLVKGLFFAGELIDLDADTGGYNLQIAYSTAWLAGSN